MVNLEEVKAQIEKIINPYKDKLAGSRIHLHEITYGYDDDKEDTSHALVTFCLGLNSINTKGNLNIYLRDVDLLVTILDRSLANVWLVDWKNDCLDDLSYLTLGVRL